VFTIWARIIRPRANLPREDPGVAEVESILANIMGGQPNTRNRGVSRIISLPGGGRPTGVIQLVFPRDGGSQQIQTDNIHE
jgi:hypothetical protein